MQPKQTTKHVRRYEIGAEGLERFLGHLEADIMRYIWERSRSVKIDEVYTYLNSNVRALSLSTVSTTMTRLVKKGLLNRYDKRRAHVYTAVDVDEIVFEERQVHAILLSLGLREPDVLEVLDTLALVEV